MLLNEFLKEHKKVEEQNAKVKTKPVRFRSKKRQSGS
jgi:hypothetical protein